VVILVLGWPVLLAGGVAGLVTGWLVTRTTRPWLGLIVGMLIGLAVAVVGFVAYADGSILP
jgi:F0F1-type ATP synthase assembly protein I